MMSATAKTKSHRTPDFDRTQIGWAPVPDTRPTYPARSFVLPLPAHDFNDQPTIVAPRRLARGSVPHYAQSFELPFEETSLAPVPVPVVISPTPKYPSYRRASYVQMVFALIAFGGLLYVVLNNDAVVANVLDWVGR